MRVLAFAASLRRASLNRRLIELVAQLATVRGADVDLAEFHELVLPPYDGDLDQVAGLPAPAEALRRRIARADGVVIASPEYNYSIPGTLKNVIDWVSRARPIPWRGKVVYLVSAAPSPMGGIRGLWQTRIPLEGCGALVFPDMFALANAHQAFAADGTLRDRALGARLERELTAFLQLAEAVAGICGETARPIARRDAIVAGIEDESELQSA